jgi:hypothetical protein
MRLFPEEKVTHQCTPKVHEYSENVLNYGARRRPSIANICSGRMSRLPGPISSAWDLAPFRV